MKNEDYASFNGEEKESAVKAEMQPSTGTGIDDGFECLTRSLKDVKEQLAETTERFNAMIRSAISLNDTISGDKWIPGLGELCGIFRFLEGTEDPYCQETAVRLYRVLKDSFGLIPLIPAPGGKYDPVIAEKRDDSQSGNTVSRCLRIGWRCGKEVLLKAIVDVIA